MDSAIKSLTDLLRDGQITVATYADAINQLTRTPTPAPRKPKPAPRKPKYKKNDGTYAYVEPPFWSKQYVLSKAANINEELSKAEARVLQSIENYMREGSGWAVERVVELFLNIARYQPLRGSSYIDLPVAVKRRHAVIPIVERQNGLAINVFGYDKGVYPLHISDGPAPIPRINLLLVESGEKQHYTWIKDLNRLLFTQSKFEGKKHFCERCLHCFTREDLLERHRSDCRGVNGRPRRTSMPSEEDKVLRFTNHHKQLKIPFVIYADFEAITTKFEGPGRNPNQKGSEKTQLHEACGFSYVVVRSDGKHEPPVLYRGQDAAAVFLQHLQGEKEKIKGVLAHPAPMVTTREEQTSFEEAENCYVCDKPLYEDRVSDRDHITGDYRGPAHNECNLKLRLSAKYTPMPVVFHNLRGYDSHLIMQAIGRTEGKITCIPNNMEKYISFSLGNLRFIDSVQFLLAPFDRLVASAAKGSFTLTAAAEPAPEKLDTQLPSKGAFYSKLSEAGISDQDYAHAQKLWATFQCRTMGDYHDLYLRTDTVLLADVFENFRSTCVKQYGLDPAQYYTSPGLSWTLYLRKQRLN
ncbi:uncharacterized protein LOC141909170 [Tubulanus polymorphus]|uniref:uncharacterized protein LOC141909170 n=1 Tax=Tubulanus polymorphus TaxID=672921 RepID=UPI003DA24A36